MIVGIGNVCKSQDLISNEEAPLNILAEWSGRTNPVKNCDWNWLDTVVGNISGVTVARMAIAANDCAHIAFAETREEHPKAITIFLADDDETKKAGVCYSKQGEVYPQGYRKERIKCGKIL